MGKGNGRFNPKKLRIGLPAKNMTGPKNYRLLKKNIIPEAPIIKDTAITGSFLR